MKDAEIKESLQKLLNMSPDQFCVCVGGGAISLHVYKFR